MSHPVWVRGLKLVLNVSNIYGRRSHPVWVRGLKHEQTCSILLRGKVAPRVGAWIETYLKGLTQVTNDVAPRVGAWIETHSI